MVAMFVIVLPKFQSMQKLIDKLSLVMREHLTGLMVIRAFNAQKHEEERFDKANQDLTKTSLFVNRAVLVFLMPSNDVPHECRNDSHCLGWGSPG